MSKYEWNNETINKDIEGFKRRIDKRLEKAKKENKNIAYGYAARDAQRIGFCYYALDDKENAVKWFKESTENYIKNFINIQKIGFIQETMLLKMLYSFILSEEKSYFKSLIDNINKYPVKNIIDSELIFLEVNAIMSIINSSPFNFDELLEAQKRDGRSIGGYYVGTAEVLEGIARNDQNRVITGINNMLSEYNKRISLSNEIPISIDILMLLKLAESKGLKINLNNIEEKYHNYIPSCMFH